MAIVFSLVGILFLFMSDGVLSFFNGMSKFVGMDQVRNADGHFYVALSVAYMYIVALLAYLMYRNPEDATFPFLLSNAKIASSVVSFLIFFIDAHLLIYVTNGVVDGLIGVLVVVMYRDLKTHAGLLTKGYR